MEKTKEFDFALLIPCYNNFTGLIESLKSVSYKSGNYIIVVVDDGSVKPLTTDDIHKEPGMDKPLVLLSNEKNLGITKTLNKGLAWIEENSSSKYIARLDCGDVCTNNRFEKQVNFLDNHPEIGLIGSWCRFTDEKTGVQYTYKSPGQHKSILRTMYFRNAFMHATVMFRTSLLKKAGYYPEGFDYAEDYAFFWKLIGINRSYISDKILVFCRLNREGISFKNRSQQLAARWKVIKAFSQDPLLKTAGFLKLKMLYVLPKRVLLWLKGRT